MTSTAPIPGHEPGPSFDPDRPRRERNHRTVVAPDGRGSEGRRHPSREDALQAVRTLIEWIGDDPDREGVLETPDRVLRAYGEFFAGYRQSPRDVLAKSFGELEGYDSAVIVRDIAFHSHCEHHMVPFTGKAHIAYLPDQRVVGLSKLARLVEVYARRLQVQERLTAQIATALQESVRPRGVAVLVEAEHHCMTMRGVRKPGALTQTSMVTGAYRDQAAGDRILRTLGLG